MAREVFKANVFKANDERTYCVKSKTLTNKIRPREYKNGTKTEINRIQI